MVMDQVSVDTVTEDREKQKTWTSIPERMRRHRCCVANYITAKDSEYNPLENSKYEK